jgi:YebC/PmpR family DNA-binding regulatory protein
MGGHNKWSQIKRQKGANDAAKSKIWAKLSRRITVESKKAGGDANAATVRAVVETAKKENMPKDAIERAISKGTAHDTASLDTITYEAYGPGGAAILIETFTDSRNRTAQEIKHLLSENGIALAAPGSAAWAFTKTAEGYEPQTTVPLSDVDHEKLIQILEKIDAHDDVENVFTNAA